MAERPWWLRIDGMPPSSIAARERAEDRKNRPLTRREVRLFRLWVACMLGLFAVGLTAMIAGLPYLGGVVGGPVGFLIVYMIRAPAVHRRQVLGLRPAPDQA